jgi:hypothetical protein
MDRRTSRLTMIAGLVLIVGIVVVAWIVAA